MLHLDTFIKLKLRLFDLCWICCTTNCCTINPQQIEQVEFGLKHMVQVVFVNESVTRLIQFINSDSMYTNSFISNGYQYRLRRQLSPTEIERRWISHFRLCSTTVCVVSSISLHFNAADVQRCTTGD
jgi:hypothetical protein